MANSSKLKSVFGMTNLLLFKTASAVSGTLCAVTQGNLASKLFLSILENLPQLIWRLQFLFLQVNMTTFMMFFFFKLVYYTTCCFHYPQNLFWKIFGWKFFKCFFPLTQLRHLHRITDSPKKYLKTNANKLSFLKNFIIIHLVLVFRKCVVSFNHILFPLGINMRLHTCKFLFTLSWEKPKELAAQKRQIVDDKSRNGY